MAETTGISWCDSTWNPWIGCTKVGPGCDNCYAEALDRRFFAPASHWGPGAERRRTTPAYWRQLRKWNRLSNQFYALNSRKRRVFIASQADVFDNAVPDEWRIDLWDEIENCRDLEIIIVTKRVGNVAKMALARSLKPNVILLATVCNQPEADRDVPKLLDLKASGIVSRVGLSIEPMLGPVDLSPWLGQVGDHGHGEVSLDYQIREKRAKDSNHVGRPRNFDPADRLPTGALDALMVPSDPGDAQLSSDPVENFGGSGIDREASAVGSLLSTTPVQIPLSVEHARDIGEHGDVLRNDDGLGKVVGATRAQREAECGQFAGNGGAAGTDGAADLSDALSVVVGRDNSGSPVSTSLSHRASPYAPQITIDWIICGGESGPNARPAHPDWPRALRDQCKAAGVPFFFKQWGEWRPPENGEEYDTSEGRAGSPPAFIVSQDGTVRCFQENAGREAKVMVRVGKRAAGSLLDGREHKEFP